MTDAYNGPVKLSEMGQSYWQGVVYGPPGCGKTSFATLSRLETFVFDVDAGVNTTRAFRRRLGMPMDNCTVWGIKSVADFDRARGWLMSRIDKYAGGLVVIDSATELARIVQREATSKSKRLTPDQREWGDIRVIMENQTVEFRYMPFNLVYTCHEVLKMDPDYGREVYRPSFDGRFAFEYAKHFSFICRLVAKPVVTGARLADGSPEVKVMRALNFGPDAFCHFKDRSGSMPQWVQLPDDQPMLDHILTHMWTSTSSPSATVAAQQTGG
jgi:hypothetical protein